MNQCYKTPGRAGAYLIARAEGMMSAVAELRPHIGGAYGRTKFAIGQKVIFSSPEATCLSPWTIANILIPVVEREQDEVHYMLDNGASSICMTESLLKEYNA